MLPPAVVVEITPGDVAPAEVQVLLDACTRAVGQGMCERGPTSDPPSLAMAHIALHDTGLTARISVSLADGSRQERDLQFRPEDEVTERWRTVGLVVGVIASTPLSPAVDPPAEEPVPPPPAAVPPESPVVPRPPPPEPAERHPLWADAGVTFSTALDDGTWRIGPWLRAAYVPEALPLLVSVSGSYGTRPVDDRGLSATWLTLGLGGAFVVTVREDFFVDIGAEVVGERLGVSIEDPQTGATDQGSRWAAGSRLGLLASYLPHPQVGVVAGFGASLLQRGSRIQVQGATEARAPALSAGPSVGLRLRLP